MVKDVFDIFSAAAIWVVKVVHKAFLDHFSEERTGVKVLIRVVGVCGRAREVFGTAGHELFGTVDSFELG